MRKTLQNLAKITLLFSFLNMSSTLQADPIRIMPLGDSITYGYPYQTGYRNYLWYKLQNAKYTVDFVGSRNNGQNHSPSFDFNHEGYKGWKTFEIAEIVYGLLEENQPDIILLHIGSNDVSPTQGTNSSSVAGLRDILNQIDNYERNHHHSIRVILASIIQRASYHDTVTYYNQNLRALANSRIANGDKITLVNMESGAGLNSGDYADATHPNYSGYSKMATVWFNALDGLLPPPVPSAPDNISLSVLTSNTVTLTWSDTAHNESGYKIYHNNTLVVTLPANTTTYTLKDLQSNTNYSYSIKSYNSNGESTAKTFTFKTKDDYAWLIAVYYPILN